MIIRNKALLFFVCTVLASCRRESETPVANRSTLSVASERSIEGVPEEVERGDADPTCKMTEMRDMLIEGCMARMQRSKGLIIPATEFYTLSENIKLTCPTIDLYETTTKLGDIIESYERSSNDADSCKLVVNRLVAGQILYKYDPGKPSLFTDIKSSRGAGQVDVSALVKYGTLVGSYYKQDLYVDPATVRFNNGVYGKIDKVIVETMTDGRPGVSHKREELAFTCSYAKTSRDPAQQAAFKAGCQSQSSLASEPTKSM